MKLVSVAQMRAIEKAADAGGLTYTRMMENAGTALADIVHDSSRSRQPRIVVGLVGAGNNGGDTLICLRRLAELGWTTKAYLVNRPHDGLLERLIAAGGQSLEKRAPDFSDLRAWLEQSTVVLDGLLGTGIKLPLKDELRAVLSRCNEILGDLRPAPFVVAVDCPSGVDCDTGEVADVTLRADLTVTMAATKQGLLRLPASERVGELVRADIGLDSLIEADARLQTDVADRNLVAGLLPPRPADAHKGTFGTAMIVAGSVNYTGAALLAGKAAYRVGAGLVSMAIPTSLHQALAGHFPEATWLLLPQELGVVAREAAPVVLKHLGRATAMLIGPGLGTEDASGEFMEQLLAAPAASRTSGTYIGFVRDQSRTDVVSGGTLPPLVVDADGLRLLSRLKDWHNLLPAASVLTPHAGEMAALTGLRTEAVLADRQALAVKCARDWGHVVVLKGAFTLVAAPDGRSTIIPFATSALARAGTGDVLAGAIVGLRAQGLAAYPAAVAGAWIHGRAGEESGRRLGSTASVMAGDVLDSIVDVFAGLRKLR